MQFAAINLDKPNSIDIRMKARPAHVEYLDANQDKIVFAGPLLQDDGETPLGSLLVIEAPDRAAMDKFLAGDPYAKAGLFQSVTVRNIRKTYPKA